MKIISQEHTAGCGVACVAFLLQKTYKETLDLFSIPSQAWGRGFLYNEIIDALRKGGKNYVCNIMESHSFSNGTIVYIDNPQVYYIGHYLVKWEKGWFDPWINYPIITPAMGGYRPCLLGKVVASFNEVLEA